MGRLRVVPIAEGDGEVQCIRILLERIWYEVVGGEYIEVIRPVRQSRGKLLQEAELRRFVRLAAGLLNETPASDDPAPVFDPRRFRARLSEAARPEAPRDRSRGRSPGRRRMRPGPRHVRDLVRRVRRIARGLSGVRARRRADGPRGLRAWKELGREAFPVPQVS